MENNISLARKAANGLKWASISQLVIQLLSLILNIILARLLGPDEFGLLAMITVITNLLLIFKDFGFGAVLISRKNVSSLDYSTVFWSNLAIGIVLTLALVISKDFIADFYKREELASLISIIAWIFTIQSFNYVQQIILRKNLKFKKLAFIGIISTLLAGGISIILAFMNFGVWSLVFNQLLFAIFSLIFLWYSTKWRPEFIFSRARFTLLFKDSSALVGTKLINYFSRNIDNLLVGRYLGASSLGIYNRAYSFMTYPIYRITGVLSSVLFPSLSIIQNDFVKFTKYYRKSIESVSFLVFLIMCIVFATADSFVLIVLGAKWTGVIPILKILTLPGALQAISSLSENVFRSKNVYSVELRLNLLVSLILIIAIVIGLQFGLLGIAYAYAIAVIFTFFLIIFRTARTLQINSIVLFSDIVYPFISYIIVVITSHLLKEAFFLNIRPFISLITFSVFSVSIYLLFLLIMKKDILTENYKNIKTLIK